MREYQARGLPHTMPFTFRTAKVGPYPALKSENRIFSLVERLWQQRDTLKTRSLQLPPYEAQINPERIKEQVFYLLQDYVGDHCNVFKPKAQLASDEDDDTIVPT